MDFTLVSATRSYFLLYVEIGCVSKIGVTNDYLCILLSNIVRFIKTESRNIPSRSGRSLEILYLTVCKTTSDRFRKIQLDLNNGRY